MAKGPWDLLICLRCDKNLSLIADTVDSVLAFTDRRTTKVMCAVDGNPRLVSQLANVVPGAIYATPRRHGWGAGLYGLLAESIAWSKVRWKYNHFLSIDYDTLFVGSKGDKIDELLLNQITNPRVGLLGQYNPQNVHWAAVYKAERARIIAVFGQPPKKYIPGEGIQGGCMLLTATLIEQMLKRGMLAFPFADAKRVTSIADDHLITLFCRMCGLKIEQLSPEFHVRWKLDCDPRTLQKKGVKVFHPTKIRPNNTDSRVELDVRNFFRDQRGRPPLR